jgi:hypothetical protein
MQRFGGAASASVFLNESGPRCDKFCDVYGRVALPRDRCGSAYRFEIVVRRSVSNWRDLAYNAQELQATPLQATPYRRFRGLFGG